MTANYFYEAEPSWPEPPAPPAGAPNDEVLAAIATQ